MTIDYTYYLSVICSYNHLCEKVSNFNTEDHYENMRNIVEACKDEIDQKNLKPFFDPYVYIYSYIDHKENFWDYTTDDLDTQKVFYTWITVGYRNNLLIHKVGRLQAMNELKRLSRYRKPFWYIPVKRQHIKKKYDALVRSLKSVEQVKEQQENGCGIFVGVLDGNMKKIQMSKRYIYLDNAYTPDLYHKYYSVSSCDLQSLCVYDVDNTRLLEQYGPESLEQKWNPEGTQVLICPPSVTMGMFYKLNTLEWVSNKIEEIRKVSDVKIVVRFKPNEFTFGKDKGTRVQKIEEKLQGHKDVYFENLDTSTEAIEKSKCVIGFNSRILVEAFRMGKPVVCDPCCICSKVSQLDVSTAINQPVKLTKEEYLDFMKKMSYSHWTLDELAKGKHIPFIKL